MELFADIVIPIAKGIFTFRIDVDKTSHIVPGMGIEVGIGARKIYMGIVWRIHSNKPSFPTKPVGRIITDTPILTMAQMRLWDWIAEYYMCTLGDVMRFALPSALKPSGLSDEEFRQDEYRPSTIKYIRLGNAIRSEDDINSILESLKRSKVQQTALLSFCSMFAPGNILNGEVPRNSLAISAAALSRMTEKDIFDVFNRETASIGLGAFIAPQHAMPQLTQAQNSTKKSIESAFDTHHCVLLHGITGSGKTEIYMHMIADRLKKGGSVMYLMPEIAMTTQLISRIKKVFGERVTVFHSGLTDRRRAEVYRRLLASNGGELVLGARSALFLPIPSLELVIVDEEHDSSYKQTEPAPRYNARDCAVWMSRESGAKCLLASATPSIESYVNATGGKYGYVRLNERYGDAQLPTVIVSDSTRALKRGERKLHLDKALFDRMTETLEKGKQVMLFQNRRGFSPWVECVQCGWVMHCPRCSVTLTYHKTTNKLLCHTCGWSSPLPAVCPKCSTPSPKLSGFGTEKIEENLSQIFPSARVLRLDRDTATSPKRYEQIISDFACGAADILVGTQMITKGFDFPGVELVGILNADNLLNYPDFRSAERAFQTITQFSGRAGRSSANGEVVIQTTQPDNAVIRQAQLSDYEGMVSEQLAERSAFGYPPFSKLIVISMRHRDQRLLGQAATWFSDRIREVFASRVYGPHAPVLEKAAGESYMEIMLKIENGYSVAKAKRLLSGLLEDIASHHDYKKVFVFCDADPQ